MAEGGGLLNRYTVINRIVGSNPIPSASLSIRDSLFPALGIAGTAQNAGLCGHLSEPRAAADKLISAAFRLSQPGLSDATEPRPYWYGC